MSSPIAPPPGAALRRKGRPPGPETTDSTSVPASAGSGGAFKTPQFHQTTQPLEAKTHPGQRALLGVRVPASAVGAQAGERHSGARPRGHAELDSENTGLAGPWKGVQAPSGTVPFASKSHRVYKFRPLSLAPREGISTKRTQRHLFLSVTVALIWHGL